MTVGHFARRVTARDVAAEVGCSVSSVSLVINGKADGRLTVEVQQEIRAAIARLGYRVNSTASALARGESKRIGFVSPDPTNPFFSMVLEGVASELNDEFALTLLMPSQGNDYDRDTLQRALAGDFAGLIVASPGRHLLDDFVATCPVILLDADGPQAGLPSIDLDVGPASRDLARHLVRLGHRVVAYTGVSRDKAALQNRRRELADALQVEQAVLVDDDLVLDRLSVVAAEEAFPSAWSGWRDAGVTAVVCGDELYAYGVLRACRTMGIAVPQELSLVGFNDLIYSELMDPSVTSVHLPAHTLGAQAAKLLQRYIHTGRVPASRTLAATLVVRGSTAQRLPMSGTRSAVNVAK